MPPMGRKKCHLPTKVHPKSAGKNVPAWWEDNAIASNTAARMQSKRDIANTLREEA